MPEVISKNLTEIRYSAINQTLIDYMYGTKNNFS